MHALALDIHVTPRGARTKESTWLRVARAMKVVRGLSPSGSNWLTIQVSGYISGATPHRALVGDGMGAQDAQDKGG